MALCTEILAILLTATAITYIYFKYTYKYWKRKGIDYIKPSFPLGNCSSIIPSGISFGIFSKPFYEEFKRRGKAFGGIFTVATPVLVLVDPSYIKDIFMTDFANFTDRGIYVNKQSHRLADNSFTNEGAKWRNSRIKLTPVFTASKLKYFFNTMVEICGSLIETLEHDVKNEEDVDARDLASRFSTSVSGTTVYGIETNNFKNVGPDFHKWGKISNEVSFFQSFGLFLGVYSPKLAKLLNVKTMSEEVTNFFETIAREMVEIRENNTITSTDVLQTLMKLRDNPDGAFSFNDIAANCFSFFVGGFDTSASALQFAFYELALHQDYQDKLRKEIRETLEESDGKITYENLKKMKFLGQVIDETLRLYPPVPSLTRVCTSDHYKLRDSDLVLDRGTQVLISTIGLHRDPDYFPDPLRFDPERFNEENKKSIPPFVYMPFGEGPRNCIGLRFGLMQTKIGLASIINKFKVTLSPKTKYPIELRNDTFLLNTVDKILIRVEKIS